MAQLRAALDSEKRSAAATHRRMVAENAELIARLREVQGSGGVGPSGCVSRASPSRGLGGSRASPSCDGSEGSGCGGPSRRSTPSRPAWG